MHTLISSDVTDGSKLDTTILWPTGRARLAKAI